MANGIITSGDFPTEQDAVQCLDDILNVLNWFKIYKEARGEIIQPRPGTQDKKVRIDRILVPLPSLVEAGWHYGAVGIECKKSNVKIGKLVAQALDYSRSIFLIGPAKIQIVPTWTFLWPLEVQTCEIASVMHQNRIGVVHPFSTSIRFMVGGKGILFEYDNKLHVRDPQGGDKTGSRG